MLCTTNPEDPLLFNLLPVAQGLHGHAHNTIEFRSKCLDGIMDSGFESAFQTS